MASMFTGAYPSQHGMINEIDDKLKAPTVAQILSDRGYQTILYGGNPWVNSSDLQKGFEKVFDMDDIFYSNSPLPHPDLTGVSRNLYRYAATLIQRLVEKDPTAWGASTARVRKAVSREIPQMEEPFFTYIHLTEPHPICVPPLKFQKFGQKYIFLPDFFGKRIGIYSSWFEKKVHHWAGKTEKGLSSKELKILNDAYDNTLYSVDHEINELFRFLDKEEILQNTVILITADHGEMLGEDGDIAHMFSFKEPLLKIPLIIHHPQLNCKRVDDLVEGRNLFHIVLNLTKENFRKFWKSSDYVYGEWKAYPLAARRVLKLNPKMFTSAKYIRTKNLKYVVYNTGGSMLCSLTNGEREIDNQELEGLMKSLLKIKERKIPEVKSSFFKSFKQVNLM